MDKRLAGRPTANEHILLGTVVIKPLQTLVHWVKDRGKRGQPFVAADFNAAVIASTSADKAPRKELKAKVVPDISKLGKFYPDLYGDCIRIQGKPLCCMVRSGTPPTTFLTSVQESMLQIPLIGNAYGLDNAM
eukprot:4366412-Ditylum_brightwellii.AAC.1